MRSRMRRTVSKRIEDEPEPETGGSGDGDGAPGGDSSVSPSIAV